MTSPGLAAEASPAQPDSDLQVTGGVMKSLAGILSFIMFLAVPLCVTAEEPPDTSVTLSLHADEEYVSDITETAEEWGPATVSLPAVPLEEPLNGDSGINDELLLLSLLEERMQDHGITADGEGVLLAQADSLREGSAPEDDRYDGGENDNGDIENNRIADPLYYWNLSMYHFNDKFYFWLLKPVAQGYKAIAPEPVRIAVSNFFQNLASPARFVGNLLQMKLKNAGDELVRFVTNSTQGLAGFMDVAKSHYGIATHEEDFGQTLGYYGIGHGFYLVLPVFGPSSLRDAVGLAADRFMYPLSYISQNELSFGAAAGIFGFQAVNRTSFRIGDYETFKESAITPYVSMRDAYVQHRKKQVKE